MQAAIYVLCAATALTCCTLLLRGFWRTRTRLLLWCAFCFLALAVENVILFIDLIVVPAEDLSTFHFLAAGVGVSVLLFGLIWEAK